MSDIQRAGIVGAGLMGPGIAEVCARTEQDVVVREIDDEATAAGRARITDSLDRSLEKGKLTEPEHEAALRRLSVTADLSLLADRGLVIEAAVENQEVKAALFVVNALLVPYLLAAIRMVDNGHATAPDAGMEVGCAHPMGPRLRTAHIPESYGGEGADALAAVIITEAVARVCVSPSLIPAVNKLGTGALLQSGSADLKRKYLLPVACCQALLSNALSEAGAGSDAAGMTTRPARGGDWWVLNGNKMRITMDPNRQAGAVNSSAGSGSLDALRASDEIAAALQAHLAQEHGAHVEDRSQAVVATLDLLRHARPHRCGAPGREGADTYSNGPTMARAEVTRQQEVI
jgi:hypothetical protein